MNYKIEVDKIIDKNFTKNNVYMVSPGIRNGVKKGIKELLEKYTELIVENAENPDTIRECLNSVKF